MSGMIEDGSCNAPQAGGKFFIINCVSLLKDFDQLLSKIFL